MKSKGTDVHSVVEETHKCRNSGLFNLFNPFNLFTIFSSSHSPAPALRHIAPPGGLYAGAATAGAENRTAPIPADVWCQGADRWRPDVRTQRGADCNGLPVCERSPFVPRSGQ